LIRRDPTSTFNLLLLIASQAPDKASHKSIAHPAKIK
jgi:hypothetical protein